MDYTRRPFGEVSAVQLEALKMAIETYTDYVRVAAESDYEQLTEQYQYILSVLCEKAEQLTR